MIRAVYLDEVLGSDLVLSCRISLDNEVLFEMEATYNTISGFVNCSEETFAYELTQPTIEATLEVMWRGKRIDNPQNTGGRTHALTHCSKWCRKYSLTGLQLGLDHIMGYQ